MENALIMAKIRDCDVFNALNILDNEEAFKVRNFDGPEGADVFVGSDFPWRKWKFTFLSL